MNDKAKDGLFVGVAITSIALLMGSAVAYGFHLDNIEDREREKTHAEVQAKIAECIADGGHPLYKQSARGWLLYFVGCEGVTDVG